MGFSPKLPQKLRLDHTRKEPLEGTAGRNHITNPIQRMIPRMQFQPKVEFQKKREQQVKILWTNVGNNPQLAPKGIGFNINLPKEPRMDHTRREPLKGTAGGNPVTNPLQSVRARRDLETSGSHNNTEISIRPGTTTAALPIG